MKSKKYIFLLILVTVFLVSCSSTEASSNKELRKFYEPSNGVGRTSINYDNYSAENLAVAGTPEETNGITICIDPGHGFEDGGAGSDFIGEFYEKDINLSVSNFLKDELTALGYGVVMTHDGENFPVTSSYDNNDRFNPYERVAYANSITSDYYVSLHCNSYASNPDVSGTRIFYYDGEAKINHDSETIAESIRTSIKASFPDADEPTSEFDKLLYVTKYTKTPASLIEMGFLTNQADAENMINPDWQKAFAKAVADGIDSYYKENILKD